MWRANYCFCSLPLLFVVFSLPSSLLKFPLLAQSSNPRVDKICVLRSLFLLIPALSVLLRRFAEGLGFLPPQKTTFINSSLIWKQWMKSDSLQISIYFSIFLKFFIHWAEAYLACPWTEQILHALCHKYVHYFLPVCWPRNEDHSSINTYTKQPSIQSWDSRFLIPLVIGSKYILTSHVASNLI